ncbi:MAG TPA: DNA-binding protein [Actinobacteria bacterium]|nr:helix-turn-helix domain protein [bacterium BMS3Bbin01]HDH27490.1 DNA-binding protein [Actinomycetota bacterium]HDL49855.1 DNA-binding protein [Actinomycetota bacterium]
MTGGTIDYDRWYPEVPAVLDTKQLAALLNTNEQIVRAWVREGIIPAHRRPGGRKLSYLRHEIFEWLLASRYDPTEQRQG